MHFENIDLRVDAGAAAYVKSETVSVVFAKAPGEVISREGANRYALGDAIITGSKGDVWSVSRGRFDARYAPVNGHVQGADGWFHNKPLPVLARQVHEAFTLRRSVGGDLLRGKPGDWLMQYAPGDYGIVDQLKFERLYRSAD